MIGESLIDVIDPDTNTVTTSVPLGERLHAAAGDGLVWASNGTSPETVDPRTGVVTGTWSGSSRSRPHGRSSSRNIPIAIGIGFDTAWILSVNGTVTAVRVS